MEVNSRTLCLGPCTPQSPCVRTLNWEPSRTRPPLRQGLLSQEMAPVPRWDGVTSPSLLWPHPSHRVGRSAASSLPLGCKPPAAQPLWNTDLVFLLSPQGPPSALAHGRGAPAVPVASAPYTQQPDPGLQLPSPGRTAPSARCSPAAHPGTAPCALLWCLGCLLTHAASAPASAPQLPPSRALAHVLRKCPSVSQWFANIR